MVRKVKPASGALTECEQQVVDLLCEGLIRKQVSDRLNRSDHTTSEHIKNICDKLGVRSQLGIVAKVLNARIDVLQMQWADAERRLRTR